MNEPTPPSIDFAEALSEGLSREFKLSGFTFIRNGMRFHYPFRESIRSLLLWVDELIVNVGDCDDGTLKIVEEMAKFEPRIKVIQNKWDDSLRKGGQVLAQQTDLALQACTGDWGIYLQADEVLHEDDYVWLLNSLKYAHKHNEIEGILFDYLHFYGDYRVINWNPSEYRHEVRAIRLNGPKVCSYRDAQGFRIDDGSTNGRKLNVISGHTRVFHYGWVRPPEVMKEKTISMDRFYHDDGLGTGDNYKYRHIYGLEKYTGTHPGVMRELIQQSDWSQGNTKSKNGIPFWRYS